MQTDPHAVRFLVTETGSKMAVRSTEMWIFDYECDAKEYILNNAKRFKNSMTGKESVMHYQFRLYKVHPQAKPKKVNITDKYLGLT